MRSRKGLARPEESDIPRGCSRCNGLPWVTVALPNGISAASRCDCPRGIWYQQKDRARTNSQPQKTKTLGEQIEQPQRKVAWCTQTTSR